MSPSSAYAPTDVRPCASAMIGSLQPRCGGIELSVRSTLLFPQLSGIHADEEAILRRSTHPLFPGEQYTNPRLDTEGQERAEPHCGPIPGWPHREGLYDGLPADEACSDPDFFPPKAPRHHTPLRGNRDNSSAAAAPSVLRSLYLTIIYSYLIMAFIDFRSSTGDNRGWRK